MCALRGRSSREGLKGSLGIPPCPRSFGLKGLNLKARMSDKDAEIARLREEVSELKKGLSDMGNNMSNMQKEFGRLYFQLIKGVGRGGEEAERG